MTIFLGETFCVSRYWDRLCQCSFVHSFDTKSAPRISRKPRITKFYRAIHTNIVYRHTGYDIIIYFRSEVIGASDGFGWNFSRTVQATIVKFYTLIEGKRRHKPVRNGITSPKWVHMQKKAYNLEMVRDMAKDKYTAASKASSNFS